MQRQHQQIGPARHGLALAHRAADLRRPRQEDQHVAGVPLVDQQLHGFFHLDFEWLGRVRQMLDRKLEEPSSGSHDGTAAGAATFQVTRNRIGIEGCRHDYNSQLGPCPLQALQQCQRKIAFQMALMELIEHHGADSL